MVCLYIDFILLMQNKKNHSFYRNDLRLTNISCSKNPVQMAGRGGRHALSCLRAPTT